MKIKHVALFCIAFSLYHATSNAQNIDKADIVYSYINMPLNRFDTTISTYHVEVKTRNTQLGNTLGNIYDAEKIKMTGYHRLNSPEDADLKISMEVVNDIVFKGVKQNSEDFTYKKNKESPTITYTAYWYTGSYYTPKIICRSVNRYGKTISMEEFGGNEQSFTFGSTNYGSHYQSQYALAAAWKDSKDGVLMTSELESYGQSLNYVTSNFIVKCPYYSRLDNLDIAYVKEKKGQTQYADLMEAKNIFLEAVKMSASDKIVEINKIIRPTYETRREKMKEAIAIWEKAISEANYNDKKARIDKKVARRIYYNLSIAYLFIDEFEKARECFTGRKDNLESFGNNMFSGLKKLEAAITSFESQYKANAWRPLLLADNNPYEYKDLATRQKEADEIFQKSVAAVKARQDSIAAANKTAKKVPAKQKNKIPPKAPIKPVPASKQVAVKKAGS